jgi:hypothetical protein
MSYSSNIYALTYPNRQSLNDIDLQKSNYLCVFVGNVYLYIIITHREKFLIAAVIEN